MAIFQRCNQGRQRIGTEIHPLTPLARQARPMRQEASNGHLTGIRETALNRKIRNIVRDGSVQVNCAFFDQTHDFDGCKNLCYRPQLVNRVLICWRILFQVCRSKCFLPDGFLIVNENHSHTGQMFALHQSGNASRCILNRITVISPRNGIWFLGSLYSPDRPKGDCRANQE